MLYVKARQDLPRHHKTRKLARSLGTGRAQAVGYLVCLWSWALVHAQDGDLSRFDDDDIAEEAGWEWGPLLENPPGDHFVNALVEAGFLDRPDSGGDSGGNRGRLRIHDWDVLSGAFLASGDGGAVGNHIRWHVNRDRIDPACGLCIPPDSGGDIAPDSGGDSVRNPREEKIREEELPARKRATARTARTPDPAFDEFWDVFGLKVDRQAAEKAWGNALQVAGADEIIAGARRYVAWLGSQANPPRHKYAQGWLNGRRWRDEYPSSGRRARALEQPL